MAEHNVDVDSMLERTEGPTKDLLLIIFIHGFKGTDSTFEGFPARLQHILSETIDVIRVESVVFPSYETKGELSEAVIHFSDWLTNLTVQREVEHGLGGGAGKAKVVLCGHSMGGLLAADALIEFVRTRPDQQAPLWPKIIACIAFDTPYLGLHPLIFKNSATQYLQSARDAYNSFQSFTASKTTMAAASTPKAAVTAPPAASPVTAGWAKWAPAAYAVGGALIAGAAAGTAYYKREEIGAGYKWATDHMKYVGTLWDEDRLHRRLNTLLEFEEQMNVTFRTFYTFLPLKLPAHPSARTFIVLPKSPSKLADHFTQASNSLASDEVQAHTGMFDIKTNDGYFELGLATAQIIRDSVDFYQEQESHAAQSTQYATSTHPDAKLPTSQSPAKNVWADHVGGQSQQATDVASMTGDDLITL